MKKNISGNVDRPIDNIDEDFLDRRKFVEYIYSVLDNLSPNSNIRISIEGPWGSGKSSVMKLLYDKCEQDGHFTAYFNPWQFSEWGLAWSGLVTSIGKALSKAKGGRINPFKRKRYIKKSGEKILGVLDMTKGIPYADVASKIGDLFLSPLLSQLEETKESIIKYLGKELGDKRMFIFIDDLDRANDEIIYNLMMFLNEVIDFNKIVYVIGLDIEVTKFTLKDRIKDVDSFLEKIINWAFRLPQPADFDWRFYISNQLKSLSGGIKKESLLSLINILPKNPRKLKLFIYYLDGLHQGFLGRFDEDELHWDIVYLIQLLRNEFPKVFDYVLNDKQLISDLAYGSIRERVNKRINNQQDENKEIPQWKSKLQNQFSKEEVKESERFFELYELIRNSNSIMSEEVLSYHLRAIDSPDLITWKEYRKIKEGIINCQEGKLSDKVREILFKDTSPKAIMWRREFINTLLMDRNRLFEEAIQRRTDPEIQEDLKKVFMLNKICKITFEIDELFGGENPVYDMDLFKKFVEIFKKWAHFNRPEHLYKELREDEKKILLTLTTKMITQASDALIALGVNRYRPTFSGGPDEAFEPIKDEMLKILSGSLARTLLERFEQFDGIRRLWSSNENKIAELKLLFNNNPSFHNKTNYEKLNTIIAKISENSYIGDNFYEYFSMLCHAALEITDFSSPQKALDLIKNKDFISIIWEGTIGKGLNLRNVGSLQDYREKLKNLSIDVDDLLPLPDWWDKVLKGEQIK